MEPRAIAGRYRLEERLRRGGMAEPATTEAPPATEPPTLPVPTTVPTL